VIVLVGTSARVVTQNGAGQESDWLIPILAAAIGLVGAVVGGWMAARATQEATRVAVKEQLTASRIDQRQAAFALMRAAAAECQRKASTYGSFRVAPPALPPVW
jgi:uncharacterized membrane protein YeaQ/YmgE (transglycosylase-associated protein family)